VCDSNSLRVCKFYPIHSHRSQFCVVLSHVQSSLSLVCVKMKFFTFLFIVTSFLVLHSHAANTRANVFREPLEEDEICPYHYCPSLKFVCAYDGRKYQYFRNRCYMLWHNYCFRGSKLVEFPKKILFKFLFFRI
jgi:hypothetical protein